MTTAVQKEESMLLQKELVSGYFDRLSAAKDTGTPVIATFVPGNLVEVIRAAGALPLLPEINALQSAMRGKSAAFVNAAEKIGHSEDVCTYVKCDIGMLRAGNIGPTGKPLPKPDLLLLSYTGCFTFLKWFELLKEELDCPIVFLHVPYQGDGEITSEMRDYVVRQLTDEVFPAIKKATGKAVDMDALREQLALSAKAEDLFVEVLESAKHKPSPIDGYFGGVFYIGPIFTAFRGTQEAIDYYTIVKQEVQERIAAGQGPIAPSGPVIDEKYRLVVEGPPNWTHFREFWRMFSDEGAVCVASTYTKVGGLYDRGFRHDPKRPLESLADYCLGCYTNMNLPQRIQLLCDYITEYDADGFLINSIKSCNSFSAGQLLMLREIEARTGRAGGFIETDLVDPRYFSAANVKNRLESYFQMIDAKRAAV